MIVGCGTRSSARIVGCAAFTVIALVLGIAASGFAFARVLLALETLEVIFGHDEDHEEDPLAPPRAKS